MLVLGDFTQKDDDTPLEKREPISVTKENFNKVMKEMDLGLSFTVPDALSDEEDVLPVDLKFSSLKDFEPDNVAKQIQPLKKLIQIRTLLRDLKARVDNEVDLRIKVTEILKHVRENRDKESLLDDINALIEQAAP